MSTELTSGEVIGALNAFRDLMKVCFINGDIPTTEIALSSTLKILPNINLISSSIALNTEIGNTFKDIKSLKTILGEIKLNNSVNSLSDDYITAEDFDISKIITIIGFSNLVIKEYKDYLAYLIYFHYYLIILCGIGRSTAIAPTTIPSTNTLYDQYILHIKHYINEIKNIDNETVFTNYNTNKEKVS